MQMMTNYQLFDDRVDINLLAHPVLRIYLTSDSGKVYCRTKIGTLSDVKHTGIFLGVDVFGLGYFMHNHYKTGRPAIVSQKEFSQGQPLFFYEGTHLNTPLETVRLGLDQILAGEPYSWHSYNCQTFVNHARSNKRASEDVEKWFGGIALTLLVAVGIKAFND